MINANRCAITTSIKVQNIFYHFRKLPYIPLQSTTQCLGNHYSHFCNQRLVLSVLELHFNEIIRCVLFPPYHLAQPKFWEFINCYLYQYFILTAEQQSIIWIYHNIFIYFPVDGHLKCFQLLAIINQAAIRRHVKAFLRAYAFVSLKQIPRKTHHIMGWAFYLFNFIKNKTTTKKTTLPASVSKEL